MRFRIDSSLMVLFWVGVNTLLLVACSSDLIVTRYDEDDPVTMRMVERLDTLCSVAFSGRKTGTIGNYLAYQYLMNEGQRMGYSPLDQSFLHDSGTTIRNILIRLEGEVSDSLIVIGAHYDGQYDNEDNKIYQAANDNASGLVTTLFILDSLSRAPKPRYSLMICFWDGEEGAIWPPFKGSSFFVDTFEEYESIVLYINIDAMGHNHKDSLLLGWYDGSGKYRVKNMVDNLNGQHLFNYSVIQRGEGEGSSDYKSFSQKKIPYISYTDTNLYCDYPQHSVMDTKEHIDIQRLRRVGALSIGILNGF